MNSSSLTRLKKTTFFALVCLSIIFAGCNTREPTASLPPQPPVAQTQAAVLDGSISSKSSDVVWDVRDEEVVWGSINELEEEGESTTELLDESDPDDNRLIHESSPAASDTSTALTSAETGEENSFTTSNASTVSHRLRRVDTLPDTRGATQVITNQDGYDSNTTNTNSSSSSAITSTPIYSETQAPRASIPPVAENGSYYGETSPATGRPKTVHVDGYYRKDGTYVRGHYRSAPRRRN